MCLPKVVTAIQSRLANYLENEKMVELLGFLLSLSGIALTAAIVLNTMDKDGKWAAMARKFTIYSSRISPMLLALYVMLITFSYSEGLLSFSIIGIYIACAAIIVSSCKELFGKSSFASDLVVVASHRASKMQDDVARKAASLAEDARKAAAEQKKAADDATAPKA